MHLIVHRQQIAQARPTWVTATYTSARNASRTTFMHFVAYTALTTSSNIIRSDET